MSHPTNASHYPMRGMAPLRKQPTKNLASEIPKKKLDEDPQTTTDSKTTTSNLEEWKGEAERRKSITFAPPPPTTSSSSELVPSRGLVTQSSLDGIEVPPAPTSESRARDQMKKRSSRRTLKVEEEDDGTSEIPPPPPIPSSNPRSLLGLFRGLGGKDNDEKDEKEEDEEEEQVPKRGELQRTPSWWENQT